MADIYSLKKRAQDMADKWESDSIPPSEVGLLIKDVIDYTGDVELNGANLGIKKIYRSESDMRADSDPVDDIYKKPLHAGNLVIVSQDGSTNNGEVYRWNKPQDQSQEAWTFVCRLSSGSIVNNPDEEDITAVHNKLQFMDRAYDPANHSGLGYKILRKNIRTVAILPDSYLPVMQVTDTAAGGVSDTAPARKDLSVIIGRDGYCYATVSGDTKKYTHWEAYGTVPASTEYMDETGRLLNGPCFKVSTDYYIWNGSSLSVYDLPQRTVNLLTQDMVNEPNCVYEIRYDFFLNGETLKLPENCTLKFEGGSIDGGYLDFPYNGEQFTIIDGNRDIFGVNLNIKNATFFHTRNNKFNPDWFVGTDQEKIQKTFDCFTKDQVSQRANPVIYIDRIYHITHEVRVTNDTILTGVNPSYIHVEGSNPKQAQFIIDDVPSIDGHPVFNCVSMNDCIFKNLYIRGYGTKHKPYCIFAIFRNKENLNAGGNTFDHVECETNCTGTDFLLIGSETNEFIRCVGDITINPIVPDNVKSDYYFPPAGIELTGGCTLNRFYDHTFDNLIIGKDSINTSFVNCYTINKIEIIHDTRDVFFINLRSEKNENSSACTFYIKKNVQVRRLYISGDIGGFLMEANSYLYDSEVYGVWGIDTVKLHNEYNEINFQDGLAHGMILRNVQGCRFSGHGISFDMLGQDYGNRRMDMNTCGPTSMRTKDSSQIGYIPIGTRYFDTDLNKPVFWNGSIWVDATGGQA